MLKRKTDPKTVKHTLCEPAQSKCTRHVRRGVWCGNLQGKCRTHIPRPAFCASLRSRNAHGHVTRCILSGHFTGSAVEMHMGMSGDAFFWEIYREDAKRPGYHLDGTPGLNCYRKNPSVWPHCLGN